ncbi:hypothetical protein AB751O23_DB_00020 [Chlamydiales bacterium SCGC AB-751-O23]|jgi:hypothetical protein|nr:hypothetical protein AB751O23_DB_00020 [Chlamydiales bacterium SCGC AB-751-O23]
MSSNLMCCYYREQVNKEACLTHADSVAAMRMNKKGPLPDEKGTLAASFISYKMLCCRGSQVQENAYRGDEFSVFIKKKPRNSSAVHKEGHSGQVIAVRKEVDQKTASVSMKYFDENGNSVN